MHRALIPALLALSLSMSATVVRAEGGGAASANPNTGYSGLGAGSVSPEVLEKFAPRPLPPELSRKVQRMMDVRSADTAVLSPDGSRLYFNWSVTGSVQVWRLDGPERFPVQLTGGEDKTTVVGISPDGKRLFIQRDRLGEENPGLYQMNAEGGPLIPIQHLPNVQTEFEWISPDGQSVYFRANDVSPDSYAIYRYDLNTQQKTLLFGEPGLWSVADARPDGRLLLVKSVSSLATELVEWDPSTSKTRPILGQGEREEYVARYGAEEGQFLVLTPKLGDFRRLYTLTLGAAKAGSSSKSKPGKETGKEKGQATKLEPVTPELSWDVAGFGLDETRTRITYLLNEGGHLQTRALDARTFQPIAMPKFQDNEQVLPGPATPSGRFQVLVVEGDRSPRTAFALDWATGTLIRWMTPSFPEVDLSTFATAKLETFPARDGTKIPVFVRRSAECEKTLCPVVVMFHGGPEGQSTGGFSTTAQLFVDAGFVVAYPNVRGSNGYGKRWLHSDNGPKRLEVVTDIDDAGKWARQRFSVDGKAPKVGIMGGSYGGYATLIGMTMFAGTYDAGYSMVGISNLLTFLENTAQYRRVMRISEYGDPVKDREALIKLSPITYIDRLSAPLMITQGASDPRVPVGEAIQMYEAAAKRQVPTQLVIFPDEGHGAAKRSNQVLTQGHALQWMEKYLK